MVTVYEDPDRIFGALRAGASGYILKRSAPEQIVSALEDVRKGGVPMSAEIARKVVGYFRQQETTKATPADVLCFPIGSARANDGRPPIALTQAVRPPVAAPVVFQG
jgi:DNA-binding NarL/FixJ family response regulator